MPLTAPSLRRKTRFPNIASVAEQLGIRRETLWRNLIGMGSKKAGAELTRRYVELAMPSLLNAFILGTLPIGSRIDVPSQTEREKIAEALGANVRAEGCALILLVPLPLLPAASITPPAKPLNPDNQPKK